MAAATERSGLETLAAALEPIAPPEGKKKRNPAPGVRVVGGRIYDPENGKTCHQVCESFRPLPVLPVLFPASRVAWI
jgi:hypothetical protein